MKAMSFLHRTEDSHTPMTSPFLENTTYCNQDVHIGVQARRGSLRGRVPGFRRSFFS